MYYLIQANGDRLWATWQRDVAHLDRLRPANVYGSDGTHCLVGNPLRPWKGTATAPCRPGSDPVMAPWNAAGGQAVAKTPKHPSIVAPPIYDTAPLRIPPLNPGESVVLQIPWGPSQPRELRLFRVEQGLFLPAGPHRGRHEPRRERAGRAAHPGQQQRRLEERDRRRRFHRNRGGGDPGQPERGSGAPGLPGPLRARPQTVSPADPHRAPLSPARTFRRGSLLDFAQLSVDLGPDLFQRWLAGGGSGQGVERVGGTRVQLFGRGKPPSTASFQPGELHPIQVFVELRTQYPDPGGRTLVWDFVQAGMLEDPNAEIGGNALADFNEIHLIPRGSTVAVPRPGAPFRGRLGVPRLRRSEVGAKAGRIWASECPWPPRSAAARRPTGW